MGYFDALIEPHFKARDPETTIFFPYGMWGGSFAVSRQEELSIRKFIREFLIASLGTSTFAILAVGPYAICILAILWPWYVLEIRRLLKDKVRTNERYSLIEAMHRMADSTGLSTMILLALGSTLLLGASLFVLLKTEDTLLGVAGSLFFGLCFLFELTQLFMAIRSRGRKRGE